MEHISTAVKEFLNKNRPEGGCFICGKEDAYNVCVACDAIVTARRIFRVYFSDFRYFLKLYIDKEQLSDVGFKNADDVTKQQIFSKLRDNQNFKVTKEYWIQDIGAMGISGLDAKEKDVYKNTLRTELFKLEENTEHMARVMKYDIETDSIISNHHDDYEELRSLYKYDGTYNKNKAQQKQDEAIPF